MLRFMGLQRVRHDCLQPYHPERTRSRLISEAKQGRGLVSTWMGDTTE